MKPTPVEQPTPPAVAEKLAPLSPVEIFAGCYRICDTEVHEIHLDAERIDCVCKVKGEIPTPPVPRGSGVPAMPEARDH